jgi:hypothetical protein
LFSEHETFIVELCGEPVKAAPKTRIDAYADAFEAFEKGQLNALQCLFLASINSLV